MSTYNVARSAVEVSGHKADLFKVGFGTSAQNDEIVRDAEKVLAGIFDESDDELSTTCKGGSLALVNGPASLPVAVVIAHSLLHRYGAVAVFDPKMSGYVVAASHNPATPLGMVIPA
ncbi:hypothetical protein A3I46_02595 [Candidatus Kaiserbacteria bacterium RIFCSPLOWO2_02_FULL_54_13]|uniref:Uncharacterized protein n=1 Tax=Candidatus Kaiserbacteria bacterium RIFCSPHIGHO2_02_FULL_54_22 TaxID=1798495 RepID=A0A1F6DLM9_9BACT|nr:MAG: hypothetical protein UY91_C0027G0016 [Parcubacteria group bacterium GW2011_GWB1_55_9]OGG62324.1 MAG: hypothetical protein A3C19_03430 [Candidatus Kaiserbacteria bacterium RIFCSPHIGHO2_02_FULL_54_22]OGG68832.1 MAG: hypothetical protein A3E99_02840 [Candidatus Kaiserbacteria bacterium RIFCSPHIGHO2_12_FULL_54_16]OGG83837.1 MAG: hypothetical protein A3I46_02595 [Candidatus Kaiserbacteria bacterium RIFCSPLOWO2_02_FULL_54_13]OGG90142.1 MAG: hypothetical protein A3G12_03140 [Candidatus Kaiserb